MKKYLFLFVVAASIALVSLGQSAPEKINQLKKDPQTAENAAKADVITINKKMITSNDTTLKNQKAIRTKKCKWRSKKTNRPVI